MLAQRVLLIDILDILSCKVNYVRAYTVAATAVALGESEKWVDNVLSHHRVPGVLHGRQGIVRRVTPLALLTLEIAARLGRALRIPMARALDLANSLITAKGREIPLSPAVAIQIKADLAAITADLEVRLEHAVEMSPTPKRGRPRQKEKNK
jgi:hypothetical protein